jgi:aspartate racemase
MMESGKKQVLGVVGGVGPLASAEFLKTIYELSFADRTEAFLAGNPEPVLEKLTEVLGHLCQSGVSQIVMCCITLHYLLPHVPRQLRKRVLSLLDVIYGHLAQTRKRHLLVCSKGTRRLGLFQNHPGWERSKDFIVLPDEEDQDVIHYDVIYQIKRNRNVRELLPVVEALLVKYGVDSFIVGCSEIHLLAKGLLADPDARKKYGCLDPLTIIAKELSGNVHHT